MPVFSRSDFVGGIGRCFFVPQQMELDGYIAAECVLCGDIMVQSVDKPLVSAEEEQEQANHWAL